MSRMGGTITFRDGTVKHFIYDGTPDMYLPPMEDTSEEVWRKARWHIDEEGPKPPETDWSSEAEDEELVLVNCGYGGGWTVLGLASRQKGVLLFPHLSVEGSQIGRNDFQEAEFLSLTEKEVESHFHRLVELRTRSETEGWY